MTSQELGGYPVQAGPIRRNCPDSVKHCLHAQLVIRARRIEDAEDAPLGHPDGPLGEIAGIDDLHRVAAIARGEDFPATRQAHGPVGEPVGGVAGTDDQAGPDDGADAREAAFGFSLASRLQRTEQAHVGAQ